MSVLNPNSDDEPQSCPLCLEYLELDDINFYPCSCGYQICRFCWNKIRTETSGLCPACRSPYAENPADFKPLTAEELAKIKEEKKKKDLAKKQKISENRKHLANVRVVQKNLVFVVGLSPRLADQEVLKKTEYFGKFGKIHKVVINHSTSYAGNQAQGPSASAYVTYYKPEDALRAINAVNNAIVDNRTLKASLGTTKYCSHFMKNQPCPKHDCMYLHELGDEAASFTKEEMQQGKHTEYEKALQDELMPALSADIGGDSVGSSCEFVSNGTIVVNNKHMTDHVKTSRTPSPKAGSNCGQQVTSNTATASSANNTGWPTLLTNQAAGGGGGGGGSKSNNNNTISKNNFRNSDIEIFRETTANQVNQHLLQLGLGLVRSHVEDHRGIESHSDGVTNCDQWSTLRSEDLFGEDDLGFDPFHETQKALAEMIESESKQQFQALHLEAVGSGSHGLTNGVAPPHTSSSSSSTINRPKQPPPGFNLLNLPLPSAGMQPNLLTDYSAHPHFNHSLQSSEFAINGFQRHPFNATSSPPASTTRENHFRHNAGLHHPLLDKSSTKDWQEGFRALLPNVNVSFGALPNSADGMSLSAQTNGRLFSSPTTALNDHHHHDRIQRQQISGWSGNDWTVLDPAIVGGQLADSNGPNNRSDSPSSWIKANLEQLTAETSFNPVSVGSLLPGFANMSLGNQGQQQQQQQQVGGLSNWGGQQSMLANTPPPGFSFARVAGNPLSYQNMSALNNTNDGAHPLDAEFRGLIRS